MSTLSICFLIGTFLYRILNLETKIIWFLVLATFGIEWTAFYYKYWSSHYQLKPMLYLIFSFIEAILIGSFFYSIIENAIQKKFVILLSLVALIIYGLDLAKNQFTSFQNFKYYLLPIIIYVIFAIFFLKQLLESTKDIFFDSNFWIVTGILFFYSGFFFLSGFINFIAEKDLLLTRKLYSINHILNIIYYSLITYGFICQRRLAKSSS